MRRAFIALFLGLIFGLSAFYFLSNSSPFDLDKVKEVGKYYQIQEDADFASKLDYFISNGLIWQVLDKKTFFTALFLGGATISSILAALHLFLDKLFFRKFHEEPRLVPAIRRSLLPVIFIAGMVYFRLLNAFIWYNVLLLFILLTGIEVLVTVFGRRRKNNQHA
jgi:hypothetical protein